MQVGSGQVQLVGRNSVHRVSERELSACVRTLLERLVRRQVSFLMQMKCQASFLGMAMPKTPARASGIHYFLISIF